MRAAATRTAVAVGLVLAMAGCGGGDKESGADKRGKDVPAAAKATATKPSAFLLSRKRLKQAEVGPADIKGYRTAPMDIGIDVARLQRISPAACRPIADMNTFASEYQPLAAVEQTAIGPTVGKDSTRIAEMALLSYTAADAPKVIADLRTSIRTCSSFHFILDDSEGFTDPRPLPDPKAGDEAVAYRITKTISDEMGGLRVPFVFVAFRTGTTIAAFYTSAAPGELDKPSRIPTDLVTAQAAKLAKLPLLG
jgi:hypothetical protein